MINEFEEFENDNNSFPLTRVIKRIEFLRDNMHVMDRRNLESILEMILKNQEDLVMRIINLEEEINDKL